MHYVYDCYRRFFSILLCYFYAYNLRYRPIITFFTTIIFIYKIEIFGGKDKNDLFYLQAWVLWSPSKQPDSPSLYQPLRVSESKNNCSKILNNKRALKEKSFESARRWLSLFAWDLTPFKKSIFNQHSISSVNNVSGFLKIQYIPEEKFDS